MIWIICAVFYSLFRAGFAEIKRHYALNRWQMSFLQAIFGFVLLVPFAPFMIWPDTMSFYLGAAGVAVIFSIGMVIQLGLAARKSGRVSSLNMPLEALAAILLWDFVTGRTVMDYFTFPVIGTTLTATFLIAVVALITMRAHDITWRSFMIVAPVALTYAVGGVVAKTILAGATFMPGLILCFVFLNFAVMAVVTGSALLANKTAGPDLVSVRTLRAGLFTSLLTVPAMLAFIAGIALAPNPGYVSFIGMLLPVWLLLWHKLFGIRDDSRVTSAVILTASIGIFIFISLQLRL